MANQQSINVSKTYRRKKQKAVDQKGGCCNHCGFKDFIGALDFHHVDPSEKKHDIAYFLNRGDNQALQDELDKCILLCANCHRRVLYNDLDISYVRIPGGRTYEMECASCDEVFKAPEPDRKYCSKKCEAIGKRVVKRPSKEVLEADIKALRYSGTGRKYGVSGPTIKKWAQAYGINS